MNHPNRLWSTWFAGTIAFIFILLSSKVSFAAPVDQEVNELRQQWAVAKYQTPRKQQDAKFAQLIAKGQRLVQQNPNNAEAHLWLGTINASYAAIKGGMGALKYAKAARKHLDISLKINPRAEGGLAHGVLGALYARLPGWPVAFGDDKKANQLLIAYVKMNPRSIDANYYYGDFLAEEGHKDAARKYLNRAKNTKVRSGHEVADNGRKREIQESLGKLR